MVVVESSDLSKTTMLMNLLIGNKKAKKHSQGYIDCNDAILIGKYLDESKWSIVQNFYDELAEGREVISFKAFSSTEIPDVSDFDSCHSSIVVFEDLLSEPKKIQEYIIPYFIHGCHSNISPIYIARDFLLFPRLYEKILPIFLCIEKEKACQTLRELLDNIRNILML